MTNLSGVVKPITRPAFIRLKLPPLWPHQERFVRDEHRYTVCVSATKTGKTTGAAWWLAHAASRDPNSLNWWIGPTFDMALPGYKTVLALLGKAVMKKTERPWVARLWNGAVVVMKTAQEPEHLRGAGLSRGVLDEAGTPAYDKAWPIIRTTITATQGPLKIIGNPGDKGGFFWRAVGWAKDPSMADWSYHQWNFLDRPTATQAELNEARLEMTESDFRRYYLGEFIEEEGAFFTRVENTFVLAPGPPPPVKQPDGRWIMAATGEVMPDDYRPPMYVVGVDPAIKSDFFVASVWKNGEPREQVEVSRHKGPPSEQQVEEVQRLSKAYHEAPVLIEVNGPGGPIWQELCKRGVQAVAFETSGKSKGEILHDYRIDMAYGRLRALKDPVQEREHYAFQALRTAGGTFKYGAPPGEHDDTVMANALANNALRRIVSPEILWV